MAATKVAKNTMATVMEVSLNCMLRDEIFRSVNG
jgi:hypothetical protein